MFTINHEAQVAIKQMTKSFASKYAERHYKEGRALPVDFCCGYEEAWEKVKGLSGYDITKEEFQELVPEQMFSEFVIKAYEKAQVKSLREIIESDEYNSRFFGYEVNNLAECISAVIDNYDELHSSKFFTDLSEYVPSEELKQMPGIGRFDIIVNRTNKEEYDVLLVENDDKKAYSEKKVVLFKVQEGEDFKGDLKEALYEAIEFVEKEFLTPEAIRYYVGMSVQKVAEYMSENLVTEATLLSAGHTVKLTYKEGKRYWCCIDDKIRIIITLDANGKDYDFPAKQIAEKLKLDNN